MDGGSFRVVFTGKIKAGENPEQAKLRLAKLFRREVSSVDALLRGGPKVIKGGLDYLTAQRYRAAVERAGGVCRVEQTPLGQEAPLRAAREAGGAARILMPVCPYCGHSLADPAGAAPPPPHRADLGPLWRWT